MPTAVRARGWGAVLLVALGATVAQAFGRFTYSVLLPAVRDDLGISNTVAGLLGTANVGAYLLGTLLIIRATATVRLLTIMRVGLALSLSGLVIAGMAPNGPVLAVGLVVMGLGGACIWIPSPAIAAAGVPEERRGLAVGMIGAGIGVGIVFAGRLAEVLRGRWGAEAWQDLYRIEAVIGVAVALAIVALLRPTAGRDPVPARASSGLAVLRTMPGWVPLTLAYAAFGFSYLLAITYLTARLEDDAGYSEGRAAAMFALVGLATVVGGVVLGAIADRVGPRLALVGGFATFAAGAAAVLTGREVVVAAGAVAIGTMFGGLPSVIATYIVQASDHVSYGPRYAVATLAFGIAQVTSPQVGGLLADVTGSFTVVFALSCGVALLGAVSSSMLPSPRAAAAVATTAPADDAVPVERR
ncbi:MAG TPA: MFS transporter [Acidimicrobiales bacterium]|nr:MFS transporter [Acidimicrobiales bacterium]